MMPRLDGNAIGGLLYELFGQEMTVSTGVCGSCGSPSKLAELHVYLSAPGTVARCPRCERVVMRVVQSPERTWVDLSGLRTIQIEN